MILFMLKYQIDIWVKSLIRCYDTLGIRKQSLKAILFLGRPLLYIFNSFFSLLDNVFYPRYKKVELIKPVIITGHPRSGTTFLHRLLTQTNEFNCFESWHTAVISLVARKLLAPVERFLKNKNKNSLLTAESGHYISLNSIEEEELIFLSLYNSPLATLFSPYALTHEDLWDMFYFEKQPERLKNEVLRYIEGSYKRQIYYLGRKQTLSKMPYAMMRYQSLMKTFPNAKFVYLIRSPYEVVPSYLSLIRAILDNLWGIDNLRPSLLGSIYRRAYQQSLRYYKWAEDLENQGMLDSKQFMTLPYHLIKTDLQRAVDDFLDFTGLDISEELKDIIRIEAEKQNSYRGKHQNLSLEYFGFLTEGFEKDFDFVLKKYGF